MKCILLLCLMFLLPHQAAAVTCNPTSTAGCNTDANCPATQGSLTPASYPGTAWTQGATSTASVDCINNIEYNHAVCPYVTDSTSAYYRSQCTITLIFPHEAPSNPNNYQLIVCIHGGGWYAGNSDNCEGQVNSAIDDTLFITKVQEYLNTPNAVGGNGIVIAIIDYRLYPASDGDPSATGGWPSFWQDAKCALWTLETNGGTSSWPYNTSLFGVYGYSAGSSLVFWGVATPDNAFTVSCPVAAADPPKGYRAAIAWPATAFVYPLNNSMWQFSGNDGAQQEQTEGVFNCTSLATCETNVASYGAEPYQLVTNANTAATNYQVLWQFGLGDDVLNPFWGSGNASGEAPFMLNAYNALTPPQHPQVEYIPSACGGHGCDAGAITGGSPQDAFLWMMNASASSAAGIMGSGISATR